MKYLAALTLSFCVLGGSALAQTEGKPAPELTATQLDGKRFDLKAYKGKVVLINFWATWCAPCLTEMPALDTYYRANKDKGFVVLAVNMDSPARQGKARAIAKKNSFPTSFKTQTDFSAYQTIEGLPATFIIDRQGKLVRGNQHKENELSAKSLKAWVTPLF
jgi:thiol-disulfide isomerase/thioredoxin